jgi:4-aminobutyrate aminotransferase
MDETKTESIPKVITPLPGPKSMEYCQREMASPAVGVRWLPVVIKTERGTFLEDVDGNVYIDFLAGAAAAITGYCHPKIVEAVVNQARIATHICNAFHYSESAIELGEKVCRLVPGSFAKKVIWGMSGSDANDAALKVVRYSTRRPRILAYIGAYHGQTYGALSLSGVFPSMKAGFGSLLDSICHIPYPYCYRCPFGLTHPKCNLYCANYLEEIVFANLYAPEDIAALFIECIQGDAGVVVPPEGYFKKIAEVCRKHGILIADDEIQTGMGRTGKVLAAQHFELEPDLVVMGKGLASGMGLSAVVGRSELMATLPPASHLFTCVANPIMLAASHATIEVMEKEKLTENAAKVGAFILDRLNKMSKEHESIGDVRGKGLMIGVEFVKDRETKEPAPEECRKICYRAWEKGLIINYYGRRKNVLRITPALTMTQEVAEKALEIIDGAIQDVESGVATKGASGW